MKYLKIKFSDIFFAQHPFLIKMVSLEGEGIRWFWREGTTVHRSTEGNCTDCGDFMSYKNSRCYCCDMCIECINEDWDSNYKIP